MNTSAEEAETGSLVSLALLLFCVFFGLAGKVTQKSYFLMTLLCFDCILLPSSTYYVFFHSLNGRLTIAQSKT